MSYYFNGIKLLDKTVNYTPQGAIISISCDASTDLPTVATLQTDLGLTPLIGSTATVVNTNETYMLNSVGTWVKLETSPFKDVYTKSETDALIAALDAASVGGTGTYIESISETDGIISAVSKGISLVPTSFSFAPISSDAVYNTIVDHITGFEITTATDLNNLTTPGVYRSTNSGTTANITNKPGNTYGDVSSRGAIIIVQYAGNTGYFRQTYIPGWNANQADKFFVRHYRGPYSATDPRTGWSNWYVYEGTDTGS